MQLERKASNDGGVIISDRVSIDVGPVSIPVDIVSPEEAVSWVVAKERSSWEVMVTPNLHHLRVIRHEPAIAANYVGASLSLADGWPVAFLASRRAGRHVERVVGENVFQALIEKDGRGRRLVLVGGNPGEKLDALVEKCHQRGWDVVTEPAPRDELTDPARRSMLVKRVATAGQNGVVVIGVGMPRQELLAQEIAKSPGAGALLCLGMSINFSSGAVRATPKIVQRLALEWLYRIAQEPRRLFLRYVADALVLPVLVWVNRSRSGV